MEKSISIQKEVYTHEYLWRSASSLLEKAKMEEIPSYRLLLPSLLMSFMAFEAFVNYCGFIILPDLWKEENNHFKGNGIEGKIAEIVDQLPNFAWRKDERPFQNVKRLETFRDIVAHGKVVNTQYVVAQKDEGSQIKFKHLWDNYLTVGAVTMFRADIQSFCESLVAELRKKSDHPHLAFNAFEEGLAIASGQSSVG